MSDYFASGARGTYGGMSALMGAPVRYYHRTLEEYVDAFLSAGLRLVKLVDVPHGPGFPRFMILAFHET